MRRIRQRHENDCGVACVAMVAGVSYSTALRTLFPYPTKKYYTQTKDLIRALKILGKRPDTGLKRKNKHNINHVAILKVNQNGPNWHWIVHSKCGRLYDPAPVEYGVYHIHSYLKVE